MMKINEYTQFNKLCKGMDPKVVADFREAWIEDLQTVYDADTSSPLMNGANSLLKYFGSSLRVIGVGWDDDTSSLVWETE
jgi:hypothetical protein